MSIPAAFPEPTPVSGLRRANWLGRYLKVENLWRRKLNVSLEDALEHVDEIFAKALVGETKTAAVERMQMGLARRAIRNEMTEMFGGIIPSLRNAKMDAAEAAVNASLYDESGLLLRIFGNPEDARGYANSLRQTARRNIEAVETRILESHIPLSEQVWKTKALTNGWIDTAINNGLARGASAKQIAEDVKALVNPDTPGGVSYAAMRLGRSEINNAFHAQSVWDAQQEPWIEKVRWNLSASHRDWGCMCEEYSVMEYFPKEDVPDKPHPNCMCYITPEQMDYEQFQQELLMGHFDPYLESVMGQQVSIQHELPETVKISDAVSQRQIAELLEDQFPEVSISGFTPENIRLVDAKEIGMTLEDLLMKYPEARKTLAQVAIENGYSNEYARTISYPLGGKRESLIKFADQWTKNPALYQQYMDLDVAEKWHPPGSNVMPWKTTTIHEFGHVLDNLTNHRTRDDVRDIAKEEFANRGIGGWANWIKIAAPSHYGLDPDDMRYLNEPEFIAEAFTDVELNGELAKRLSKLVTRKLIGYVRGKK